MEKEKFTSTLEVAESASTLSCDFLKYFHCYRRSLFTNTVGNLFPAREVLMTYNSSEGGFQILELLCWTVHDEPVPCICLSLFHNILSKSLLLYCLQTLSPHTGPAGKGSLQSLWHFNEQLVSWACRNLQHLKYLYRKCIIVLRKKALRGFRESYNFAVQKEVSSQETTTT